jgi:ATP/maltotriose-dependent transcriptional regulator MalT
MQETNPLIRTKLHLPSIRPNLVPRPRLQEQVVQGLRGPLTLVIAPAGFGKTTLLASCVTGSGVPVAWLSLDKDDNQEGRFLNYVVAALQEADNTIGREAAQMMASSHQVPPQVVLTSLINDLDSAGGEIALVLDDYQFINSQAVHEQVAFLLEHCPNIFHLAIATRSDPPLLLARLRACGQTVELRAADLSFTEPEAAQFLNDVMGLSLDARSVTVLEERTEGWIAGLQMAALSMRDREDVFGFIEGFSGTNRYILDYLLEEVLASQSPEIQRFLLCTSILERLTAPLCDTILANDEGSNSDDRSTRSESLFLAGCRRAKMNDSVCHHLRAHRIHERHEEGVQLRIRLH